MVTSLIKSIIQLRRALSSEWEQHKDVVPAVGEPCFVADKNILKIGDGSTKFSDLEPIGVKFTADGKSIVLEDKTFKLIGFESAAVGAQPRKTKNGNIEWVIPVDYADDIADLQSNINTAKVELRARMTDAEAAIDKLEDLVGTEKVVYAIASAVKIETDRAEDAEAAIDNRVKVIESDYLKKSDKEALQAQINTMASSPDIENVISSINEFTQYIEEHGEIADGFRTDIDTNKENIGDLDARLQVVEESGSGEQAQADWSVSDAASSSYVQHRTHYVEFGEFETIFEEAIITLDGTQRTNKLGISYYLNSKCFKDDNGNYLFVLDSNKAYSVTYDGETYLLYPKPIYNELYLGNPLIASINETEDSNLPFAIDEGMLKGSMGDHTLKIQAADLTFHPLRDEFIPDTIARVLDLDSALKNEDGSEKYAKTSDMLELCVPSDFNQADPNAPDYIKNRTHGISFNDGTEILTDARARAAIIYGDVPNLCKYSISAASIFESGVVNENAYMKLYVKVNQDDDSYVPLFLGKLLYNSITDANNTVYDYYVFGNRAYLSGLKSGSEFKMDLSSSIDTGVPAVVVFELNTNNGVVKMQKVNIIFNKIEFGTSPLFKIDLLSESIMTLDEKYIPDTIARVADIQTLIDNSLGVIENGSY